MDAALLDAQRLRVARPRPFPWTRGINGAALGHAPVPLAVYSDDLVLVGRRTRASDADQPECTCSIGCCRPKRRRLRLDTGDARFVAVVDMMASFLTGDVGLQHCSGGAKLLDEGRD